MATLEQLGRLPPIAAELDLFEYAPLDSARKPPSLELRACLARSQPADADDAEGLRLAFVTGHPIDSVDLVVLAYLWRPTSEDVVWGVERWSSPERRLRPYSHDPTFRPAPAGDVHAELQRLDTDRFARRVRAVLAG